MAKQEIIKGSCIRHQANKAPIISIGAQKSRSYLTIIQLLCNKINIKWTKWIRAEIAATQRLVETRELMWSSGKITQRDRVKSVNINSSLWINKVTRFQDPQLTWAAQGKILKEMNSPWVTKSSMVPTLPNLKRKVLILIRIRYYRVVRAANSHRTRIRGKRTEFTRTILWTGVSNRFCADNKSL